MLEIAGAPVDSEAERMRDERRELERRWSQLRWHEAQVRRHKTVSAQLIGHHEQEANRLARELGIDDEGDAA